MRLAVSITEKQRLLLTKERSCGKSCNKYLKSERGLSGEIQPGVREWAFGYQDEKSVAEAKCICFRGESSRFRMDDDAEKELWQMQEKKYIDEEKIGRENL